MTDPSGQVCVAGGGGGGGGGHGSVAAMTDPSGQVWVAGGGGVVEQAAIAAVAPSRKIIRLILFSFRVISDRQRSDGDSVPHSRGEAPVEITVSTPGLMR
jgi:hypothetical protein